ncbi:ParA family protein, partial [Sphingomonas sp. 66-10]|uniref:ParA family protein n=1 Tax=Sphingomonas sp. 66-10 TaxID=1895848 RepID=UPI00257F354E
MLKACEDAGTDLVVIDGAAVARDVAYEAARHADFILIPTKTAVFDTMSMTHTLDVVRQLDRAFAVVLTFVAPQGQETGDAIQAVAELGATVCPVTIGNRKAFFRAQAAGQAVQEFEPHGPAAEEIRRLYEYTNIRLYNQAEAA